jgi:thiamine kinase-like enzyme
MTHYLVFICILLHLQNHASTDWQKTVKEICLTPQSYRLEPITGGASNINYRLSLGNCDYFVRFAPQKTDVLYADLGVEYEVLKQVSKLGISATPLHYDPLVGVLITDFIEHENKKIDLKNPQIRAKVFTLLHAIENSDIKISRTFEPYRDVMQLVESAKMLECDSFTNEFYQLLLPTLMQIDTLLSKNGKKSLCHLDLHSKNVLQEGERIWIVDWEYATMSHPYLVLASMASIERWDDAEMQRLLNSYVDGPTQKDFHRLYLYRIVADIFWTVWNHIQEKKSSIDNPYAIWEKLFYDAAYERIHSEKFTDAIKALHE